MTEKSKTFPVQPVTGYSCPNCGTICSEHSLVSMSDTEFNDGGEGGDPHYEWVETHKCVTCETEYTLNNAT